MRDLIRKILREEVDRKSLETKIHRWSGDSEAMKDIWAKLRTNASLSDEEYKFAEEFFKDEIKKREKSTDTVAYKISSSNVFKPAKDQKDKITELGKNAYLNLIKTDLSIFFNNIFNPKLKLKIETPNDDWFKKNYNDLVVFGNNVKQWENNTVYWMDGPKMTIKKKIDELKTRLKNKDFIGIIEGNEWSILNRIDTHYTFWADEIGKRQKNHDLPMGSDISVIEGYFKHRRLESVLPKHWYKIFEKIKTEKNLDIKGMSFAHVDLLEKFHEEKEHEFNEMKNKVRKTTEKGDKAENNFVTLMENSTNKVNNVIKYTTWGNVVDMVFGIDLTANFIDGFRVVQVKSSEGRAKYAFVKNLGIPYLTVFPSDKENIYIYSYFSEKNKDVKKSFNMDYINVEQNAEIPVSYKEKEKNALDKVLGKTKDDYFG